MIYIKGKDEHFKVKNEYKKEGNKYIINFKSPIDATIIKIHPELPIGTAFKINKINGQREFAYYVVSSNKINNMYIVKANTLIVVGGIFKKDENYQITLYVSSDNNLLIKYLSSLIPAKQELNRTKFLLDKLSYDNYSLQNDYNSVLMSRYVLNDSQKKLIRKLERKNKQVDKLKKQIKDNKAKISK